MKGRFLILLALILVLSGGRIAMAKESGHTHHSSSNSSQENSMQGMDMSGNSGDDMQGMDMSGNSGDDMQGMDMSGDKGDNMQGMDMSGDKGDSMQGMDKGGSSGHDMQGMDMGGGPIKETPPNVKVLGTYAAINLLFIVIGIWNKWFRRKGESYGNAN